MSEPTILVVDDEPSISEVVTIYLQRAGYQVAVARVFEQFYRGEKSRSRATGGAGLGLAIAKGIVEAHGGRIWAESQVGHGTQLFFSMPVKPI